MNVRLTVTPDGALALETPYDARLVAALKSMIPMGMRRWEGSTKRWLIDPAYGVACVDLCRDFLGVTIPLLAGATTPAPALHGALETRLLKLEYLGRCKDQGAGNLPAIAAGWHDGAWGSRWPESVLRAWFEPGDEPTAPIAPPTVPAAPATLYAVLLCKPSVTLDALKSAYRRMARLTHPDVNQEPDAAEQFRRVRAAWDVLSDPRQRKKYDFGLKYQKREAANERQRERRRDERIVLDAAAYRSPLRCGWVLVEGRSRLGQLEVTRILGWEDVTNDAGQLLVTSWPAGATQFHREWV